MLSEAIWERLVGAMGDDYRWLLTDQRTNSLANRLSYDNAPFIHGVIEEWVMKWSSIEDVEQKLRKADVPVMRIKEFEEVSSKYFDKLKKKIQIISRFEDIDYWNLIVKTDLRKYQYMNSLRKINSIKDEKEKSTQIAIWEKVYYTDSIPEGW